MFNTRKQLPQVKAQNDYSKSQAKLNESHTHKLIAFSLTLIVVVAVLFIILAGVHFYFGRSVVEFSVFGIVLLLLVGIAAFVVDRFQERSVRFTLGSVAEMSRGLNEQIKQNAKTQGLIDQENIRVLSHQQKQQNRIEASHEIRGFNDAVYEDEPIDGQIRFLESR